MPFWRKFKSSNGWKMMKNTIVFGILAALLSVAPAYAEDAMPHPLGAVPTAEVPLMVIRFNHQHVAYERALYDTMVKALQVRPAAKFDIVSVSKRSSDAVDQQRYNDIAAANTAKVMATFHEIGMPLSRLNVTTKNDAVPSSEVRIYVR